MSEEIENCQFSNNQFYWFKGCRGFTHFDFKDQSGVNYEDVKKRQRDNKREIYEPLHLTPTTSQNYSEVNISAKKRKMNTEIRAGYFEDTVAEFPVNSEKSDFAEIYPEPFTRPETQSGRYPDFAKISFP